VIRCNDIPLHLQSLGRRGQTKKGKNKIEGVDIRREHAVGELIGRPSMKLEQVNTTFNLMETVWEVCSWMEEARCRIH